jgi:hypothetical protein
MMLKALIKTCDEYPHLFCFDTTFKEVSSIFIPLKLENTGVI